MRNAFGEFVAAFDGFDALARAAISVETLGATEVSRRISLIRSETLAYVMSLRPPIFKAKDARDFEQRVDQMMDQLVSAVRNDFGTDAARATRPVTQPIQRARLR